MAEKKDRALAERVVERYLIAMSNLRTTDTGVAGTVIWVSSGEFAGADAKHGPRIKVAPGVKITPETLKDAVSVRLTSPPEVLGKLPGKVEKQVVKFVNTNRETLLRYWGGQLSTREMLDLIEKV